MKYKRQTTSEVRGGLCSEEKRKHLLRKRYHENVNFREHKLKTAFERYSHDAEFKANVRQVSKERYQSDKEYQRKTKKRSVQM